MPIVEVNEQEIEFPDNMTLDEIRDVLRAKFPAPAQIDYSSLSDGASSFKEGDTATNPRTGQKITYRNGKWR
jgi:hypothetical protein